MNYQATQFIDLRNDYNGAHLFTFSDWDVFLAPKLTLMEQYSPDYWAWNMFHPLLF